MDTLLVRVHRLGTDEQLLTDLGRRVPLGRQSQHIALTLGQSFVPFTILLLRVLLRESLRQDASRGRPHIEITVGNGAYRVHQLPVDPKHGSRLPGRPGTVDGGASGRPPGPVSRARHRGSPYLTAADQSGMMVSYIQSNYQGFGSGIVVDGISTVDSYRAQFKRLLRQGAHVSIVAQMREKLTEDTLMFARSEHPPAEGSASVSSEPLPAAARLQRVVPPSARVARPGPETIPSPAPIAAVRFGLAAAAPAVVEARPVELVLRVILLVLVVAGLVSVLGRPSFVKR